MDDPDTALARLTANERQALRLLAEGHTAKSIAAAVGSSEGAVNGRLREARRKTGVGSSRELARLMRARENRDEQIGMAPPPPADAPPCTSAAPWWRRRPEVMVMILFLAGAAAFLTLQAPLREADDPVVKSILGTEVSARERYAQLIAEPREDAWADSTEPRLRRIFAAQPGIPPTLIVVCRSRTCMVVGTFAPEATTKQLSATVQHLQTAEFERTLPGKVSSWTFRARHGKDPTGSFLTFLDR